MKFRRPKITKTSFKRFSNTGFFVAIFSGSLPLLDYTHQDKVISEPSEVILLIFLFALTSLVILASYSFWLKTNGERIFATVVTSYALIMYFPEIIKAFSGLRSSLGTVKSGLIIEVTIYLGTGLIAIVLRKVEDFLEKKRLAVKPLVTIVKFVCAATFIINLYRFGSYIDANSTVSTYKPAYVASITKLKPAIQPQPDIYYFVFDRYVNSESLQNYFDFDNSDFLNQLRAKGFIIRDPAFSNYQFTAPSVASTLRMGYHNDLAKDLPGEQPSNDLPYKNIIDDSQTVTLLRGAGYDTFNFGNWWNVTRKLKNATNILPQFQAIVLGNRFILSELQSNFIGRSFLGSVLKRTPDIFGTSIVKISGTDTRQLYLGQLKEISQLAGQPHSKPRFVFAHFLNAHPPYVFNPDGSQPTYSGSENNDGASRKVKYVNQLKYANSTALELIDTIQKQSKTPPIIIIQADEGPYPLESPNDWKEVPTDTLKLKFSILAAYALPGVDSGEAGKIGSSVNAFRFVFNNYFGTKLDYLPDCSYIYNSAMPFTYYSVTAKLHGQENPNCK